MLKEAEILRTTAVIYHVIHNGVDTSACLIRVENKKRSRSPHSRTSGALTLTWPLYPAKVRLKARAGSSFLVAPYSVSKLALVPAYRAKKH